MKFRRAFFIGGNIILIVFGSWWTGTVFLNQHAIAKQSDGDTKVDRSILSPELVKFTAGKNDPQVQSAIFLKKPLMIDVAKEEHTLRVYRYGKLEKEYDVNVRAEADDRKIWEDDQTPEGLFFIETTERMSGHSWRRWMRLNTLDKARVIYTQAYADGAEKIKQYEEKFGSIENDEDVKQFNAKNSNAKLLRGIGIHGGYREDEDWTQGCVALNDHDIDELFEIVLSGPGNGIGTPVIIHD